jgi:hypothetical protein
VDNRLLKGFEYTARYNLGHEVPFVSCTDTTGKYRAKAISAEGRGGLRPVYEMVWNHYQNRRGIQAPYTRQAAEKIRPEGAAHGADHPGFGTLLFTRQPDERPPHELSSFRRSMPGNCSPIATPIRAASTGTNRR